MLDPVFQFAEKFITDFSWRRLALFFSFIALLALTLVVYEWQTATFELSKYERAAALLQELETLSKSDNKDINIAVKEITKGVNEIGRYCVCIKFPKTDPSPLRIQHSAIHRENETIVIR